LLQTWVDLGDCFHPGRTDLLRRVEALAGELGGQLAPPRLSWKYRPVKALFGWKAAKGMSTLVSNLKLMAHVQRDRLPPWAARE
jgi:hypothetical protein